VAEKLIGDRDRFYDVWKCEVCGEVTYDPPAPISKCKCGSENVRIFYEKSTLPVDWFSRDKLKEMAKKKRKDGVLAYRQNGRSVERLTKKQLGDVMEQFPRTSDAYRRASLQLDHILQVERDMDEPFKSGEITNETDAIPKCSFCDNKAVDITPSKDSVCKKCKEEIIENIGDK